MWMTSYFAEVLCPSLEAEGVVEAGVMDCQKTSCNVNGTVPQKIFKPPNHELPFPNGCASWREKGRPGSTVFSTAGPVAEWALR